MAREQDGRSIIHSLTKPKGAMMAVPAILGAALLVSVVVGGGNSVARDAGKEGTASSRVATAGTLPNAATTDKPAKPLQLAAADKPAANGSFSAAQEKEIGAIVRRYLLANPEVLVEVSTELERRRKQEQEGNQSKVLIREKLSIFRSPHDFVLGNPDGDITIVEYFDYNCGWCKRAYNEVTKLTADDKKVRIVMKEFPIFGEASVFAAKAALASIKQNKYWQFHTALMKAKRVTVSNTMDIAKRVGIDVDALRKEMEDPKYGKAIAENSRIAQALGMQGTPGFIVDAKVNFGYVPADGLKKMVSDVRKEGCKVC